MEKPLSKMEKKLTRNELAVYLKEAGVVYEYTMNVSEMTEIYQTLELSKTVTSQDNTITEIKDNEEEEEEEVNSRMLEDLCKNSVLVSNASDFDRTPDLFDVNSEEIELAINSVKDKPVWLSSNGYKSKYESLEIKEKPSAKSLDFNNVDPSHPLHPSESLAIIQIKPIYKLPTHYRPEFLQLTHTEREHILEEFHRKLLADLNYRQRQSRHYATFGRPVQPSSNFNGMINKHPDIFVPDDFQSEDSDAETEEIVTSRAGRQTKRKIYTESKQVSKSTPTLPARKKLHLDTAKSENNENCFKLFSASPTRCEKMFDKLKQQEPKRIEEERKLETFKSTLSSSDEEIVENDNIAEIVHSEEPFRRQRVEPPPYKNDSKKKKPTATTVKVSRKGRPNKKANSPEASELPTVMHSESTPNKNRKGVCPLCNEQFFKNELEEHASYCCDNFGTISSFITTRKKENQKQTMTCESCDETFLSKSAYEDHVKKCVET